MNLTTARKFASRDSATALLRKHGIARADYNDYICHHGDFFYVDMAALEADTSESASNGFSASSLQQLTKGQAKDAAKVEAPRAEGKAHTKALKTVVAKANDKPARLSISSTARNAILAGKTNEEVWEELVAKHQLPANRKHYPAWYRCELRRAGHVV